MNLENSKAQMRRGVLEFCVLAIIKAEGDMYPSDIIKKLKAAELIVVEGTLYPLLNRLKKGEILSYKWVESTSGPPRKYYELTELGIAFLEELQATWDGMAHTVNKVVQDAKSNIDLIDQSQNPTS